MGRKPAKMSDKSANSENYASQRQGRLAKALRDNLRKRKEQGVKRMPDGKQDTDKSILPS